LIRFVKPESFLIQTGNNMITRTRHVFIVCVQCTTWMIFITRNEAKFGCDRPAQRLANFRIFAPELAKTARRLFKTIRRDDVGVDLRFTYDKSVLIDAPFAALLSGDDHDPYLARWVQPAHAAFFKDLLGDLILGTRGCGEGTVGR